MVDMSTGVQWNAKAVLVASVTGIIVIYAGYNLWQTHEEVAAATKGAAPVESSLAKKSPPAPAVDPPVENPPQVQAPAAVDNTKAKSSKMAVPNANQLPAAAASSSARLMKDVQLDKEMPANLKDKSQIDAVKVEEKTVSVTLGKTTYTVFYREVAGPTEKVSLLLLHGMAFTSENWANIKTIQIASRMGHHVVAVDLPGYGQTLPKDRSLANKGEFIDALIGKLALDRPVIVSPSMSGSFALPFILGDFTHKPRGYIPVAPPAASEFEASQYKKVNIPVVVLYGSKDARMGVSSAKHLTQFPNNKVYIMQDCGHPAYLDKPDEWHTVLYNFLKVFENKK